MKSVSQPKISRSARRAAAGRRHDTFPRSVAMSPSRLRAAVDHMIGQGWTPAIEHAGAEGAADNYWYMWKLPMFGEMDIARIIAELEECREAWPNHLVRLIGYDNDAQSLGASMVIHRPGV